MKIILCFVAVLLGVIVLEIRLNIELESDLGNQDSHSAYNRLFNFQFLFFSYAHSSVLGWLL